MSNRILFTLTLLLPAIFAAQAQNLVPNPSFEQVRNMPAKKSNSISCTKNWLCPTSDGVADFYISGARKHFGVPRNIFGHQKAHSGSAYAGICVRTNFIEYLETALTDTLQKDQDYLVEFYVSRAERSIGSVKAFGVFFSPKINLGLSGIGIAVVPSLDFKKLSGYKNKRKWMKLSAVYRASGNETALSIGYFNYDKTQHYKGFAHYYVDDVSVTPILKAENTLESYAQPEINTKPFAPIPGEPNVLESVAFANNQSTMQQTSNEELIRWLKYLLENPSIPFKIAAHCSLSTKEDENLKLSDARAKAVADYFVSKGIDPSLIKYQGYGSARPIASAKSKEGKRRNQRIEITVFRADE